jgi:hypothetical protein
MRGDLGETPNCNRDTGETEAMTSTIIERVRRLLALSTSDNVHEAAAAAAKAQQLMTEHEIAQADLDIASGAPHEAVGTEVFETGARNVPWRSSLANVLAKANGAHVFSARDRDLGATSIKIVGTPAAISTVRYLHAYLVAEVERLCRKEQRETGETGAAFANAFRLGASAALCKRIMEAKADALAAAKRSGHGAAIVRIDSQLARVHAALPKLGKGRPAHYRSRDGFAAGRTAAQGVVLGGSAALGRGTSGSLT